MKLSDELKHCLDGSGCKNCESYEPKSVLTCRGLLEKAYERIKGYEDLEEQGKLLRLPIAVGDTVYDIVPIDIFNPNPKELKIRECKNVNLIYIANRFNDFGKWAFLTKSEAESALQKMNEMEE